jgi:matrixin
MTPPDAGAVKRGRQPGSIGLSPGQATQPQFVAQLDLDELIELNNILEDATSGLIKPGPGFARDPARPQRILALVRDFFARLSSQIRIDLGTGVGAARFLKARFTWSMDKELAGVAALGQSRTQMGSFSLADPIRDKNVTAYIFEGAIADYLITHLGSKPVNAENVFAAFAAHELGHNLGLEHADSPEDVMFVYNMQPADMQKHWLEAAATGKLEFKGWQVMKMSLMLDKP